MYPDIRLLNPLIRFGPASTRSSRITGNLGRVARFAPGRPTVRWPSGCSEGLRADDEIRTRDPHLGKVMRYQLRYIRVHAAPTWISGGALVRG